MAAAKSVAVTFQATEPDPRLRQVDGESFLVRLHYERSLACISAKELSVPERLSALRMGF